MTRVLFALLLVCFALPAHADYRWQQPGVNPYVGTPQHALERLAHETRMPEHVRTEFRRALSGPPPDTVLVREESIPDNLPLKGMMFGEGQYISDVTAATAAWPSKATRLADVYVTYDPETRTAWYLIRPHVCDNWSVAAIPAKFQCVCPPGTTVCN